VPAAARVDTQRRAAVLASLVYLGLGAATLGGRWWFACQYAASRPAGIDAAVSQLSEGGRVPTPQSAPGDRAPTPFSLVSLASVGAASAPNGGGGSGGGDQLPGSASVQHQYPAGSSATSKRPRQPTQQANSAQEFWRSAPTGPCSTETPSLAAVRGAFGPHRLAWPPVARRFAPIAPRWPAAAPRRKWPHVLILLARRTPRSRMRAADLGTSMHV